ncbi:unnamed protein product [Hermetia illucens]|uniref:C2H2-type domain-containing protein n=1 Tax=Hermetia illucens TaxID=343691 RepID=A0A7R8V3M4_HERIL|nr:zinc finger protein rotund-like [Hermetia illucens]CAD7092285.1 unnamed protein product [Hermetia illucens]
MAEIPAGDYLHRSIDQLRSMNERAVLGPLGHLTSTDLRASLVHDYKPFINDLRQNVERMDYVKNGLDIHRQNGQQGGQPQGHQNGMDGQGNNNQGDDLRLDQQQPQLELKQSYSAPSTPPTPLSIAETQMTETKVLKSSRGKKLFTPKSEMQLHNQLHMREAKPYKCAQCTKAFANSSYLSQHARIHLGIKPYRCEICQRKFTQLSHLQQHIRTHTGDKPYKCRHPGCQKAFSQLSNLQSHSRCHQTDKPYKCNSCYKCFSDEQALLEHIPKHKESKHLKTHICNFCGKSYTQETYLQKHMQKHAEKAEKQARAAANSAANSVASVATSAATSSVALAGLGLNLNRNIGINVAAAAAVNGEHPYWPKVSPDSAASLAEAMQQQQQNSYDFALAQQQSELQSHHRTLLEHHRALNGSTNGNNSQNSNEEGEDLVVSRQQNNNALAQHLSNQQTSPVNQSVVTSVSNGNYDAASITKTTTNSAFTPINTMPPHINTLGHHTVPQRSYFYDAINFQTKNVNQNTSNAFPNQLISLHQIRNYAHQPSATGLMAGEHLLGIGVGAGKEKAQ